MAGFPEPVPHPPRPERAVGGSIRIGVDLGGTKIEALALQRDGTELARLRVSTPRNYTGTLEAIAGLVERLEAETGQSGTVGVGIPGTIGAAGVVKNANSTWLNGQPLDRDLARVLGRPVRLANDANCLAVSEATDGAAAGLAVVFAVILGTGCGGGLALGLPEGRGARVHAGPNGIAGEWGHNPLPWPTAAESPGPPCYCGRRGCMELWVSGTGLERDFHSSGLAGAPGGLGSARSLAGSPLRGAGIVAAAEAGDPEAEAALARYEDRLARGLAMVAHVLDPDIFVLGGGVSRVQRLYRTLPALVQSYTFGGEFATPIVPARFGDSSGVRGAAWLWPAVG